MNFRISVYLILFVCVVSPVIAQDILPDGEGRDIVEDVCSSCHSLLNITDSKRTPAQWQYVVSQMISQGAPLEEYEIETVVSYLSKNFGKDTMRNDVEPDTMKSDTGVQ
ncbi:MAG: c-type cytochrome [Gammaproteobacteria bacterium]|jgi:hypothetical protein